MNNTKQKIEQTKKELKEWFESPINAEETYFLQPIQKIKEMSEENKIRKSILNGFETLNNWYRSNFIYNSLINNSINVDNRVKLAENDYQLVTLTDNLSEIYPNNPPTIMFDYAAFHLADVFIMKWEKQGETIIKYLNKALATKTLKGGMDFKPTSWFILEIVNKGFKINYDYSQFNYPENMGVYQKALDNWSTKDMKLVDEIVSEMCTFHIFQASHGSLSDSAGKSDPMFLQFSKTTWFVYAFEVLTWLAVREKQGLKNPETFSHPLMQIALNQPVKEVVRMPQDELFNKIIEKLGNVSD